jgi:hypothetical protein
MMLQRKPIVLCLFLLAACQLSPKMATHKDEIYGDGALIYIHHRNSISRAYEVYIDKKRVDPEILDKRGLKVPRGKHAIDVVDKKSSDNLKHFDILVEDTGEKHFNLCVLKSPSDVVLESRETQDGLCVDSTLDEQHEK